MSTPKKMRLIRDLETPSVSIKAGSVFEYCEHSDAYYFPVKDGNYGHDRDKVIGNNKWFEPVEDLTHEEILETDKMRLMYLSRRFTTSPIHAWRGKVFAYTEATFFRGMIMNPTTGEFTRTYKEGYKERLEEIEKYWRVLIEAEFTNSELELLGIKKNGEWT